MVNHMSRSSYATPSHSGTRVSKGVTLGLAQAEQMPSPPALVPLDELLALDLLNQQDSLAPVMTALASVPYSFPINMPIINNNNNTVLPPSPPHDGRSLSPPDSTSAGSTTASSDGQEHICKWDECSKLFNDAETLYAHLCADHVGRKSTGNLCLTCKWKDCSTSCAKRDHITSHLRVHTPLKPHVCEVCQKSFKRPQDLKKHEKIHTEEHHAQHKHSKAITVSDPEYVQRVRGQPPYTNMHPGAVRMSGAGLPTPSPELGPAGALDPMMWSHPTASAGMKRSRAEYGAVDEFLFDVKKRCIQPSYDPHMVDRLNTMVHGHGQQHHQQFNPTSISLDIRSETELAMFNNFLLTLGRDVSSGIRANEMSQAYANAGAAMPQNFDFNVAQANYFDQDSLRALGLAGMPGIDDYATPSPTAYTSSSGSFGSVPSSRATSFNAGSGTMYPELDDMSYLHNNGGIPQQNRYANANPSYYGPNAGSPAHSTSSSRTPPTPQHHPLYEGVAAETQHALASTRMSRGQQPSVHLNARQYPVPAHNVYRDPLRLQNNGIDKPRTAATGPMEPRLAPRQERGMPGKLPSLADSPRTAATGSLDPSLTLPPLRNGQSNDLPSLQEYIHGGSSSSTSQRAQHAMLIRDLLVRINADFKRSRARRSGDDSDSSDEELDEIEEDAEEPSPSSSSSGTASPPADRQRDWTASPRSQHSEYSPRQPLRSELRDAEMVAA